jgi:bacteriocin biosynthesis cyclodehydratase domain-containing protein
VLRPRIKRTTELVAGPGNALWLMRPSVERNDLIEDLSDVERKLLYTLDGSRSLRELESEFGVPTVEETISQLHMIDVLEDAADDDALPSDELIRFDRQLRYFSDMGSEVLLPSQCQARLRDARVAVLGVGGLGGRAAWDLACCGIGEMWLIDGDRVEASNLNRQTLYTEADVGLLKVEVAAARLRSFNSSMRITATPRRLQGQDAIADFIAGADVVVDAADWPPHEIERSCNAACFEVGIPYITMSNFPPFMRLGPLYVPGRTGCYSCQEISFRRDYPLFDSIAEQQSGKGSPAATFGPACGVVAGQVAADIVHLLTGLLEPATLGVACMYDLRTMEVKREQVIPEPHCLICSHLPHDAPFQSRAAGRA